MQPHWLRDRRKELDMQQGELAARLEVMGFNVTQSSISHWENGRYTLPLDDPNFRQSLAKALKLSESEMLERAGYQVVVSPQSEDARRAASIVDRLPETARELALDYLKMLEKRFVE
jgi:transcriptional regulator with XRE-family HTH domain